MQIHDKFLHATGRKLGLHKCFWKLVQWTWEDREAHIQHFDSTKDTDNRLMLKNSDDGAHVVIKRIGLHEDYRTLGVLISASGIYRKQSIKIKRQIEIWCAKIRCNDLTGEEIRIVFF